MFAKLEPLQDHGDVHHSQVAGRQLLVASGDPSEAINRPLNDRSLPVSLSVIVASSHLVRSIRNNRLNLPVEEPVSQDTAAVALVPGDRRRSHTLRHALKEQDGLRAFMLLPLGYLTEDRLATALGREVQLASPSAARRRQPARSSGSTSSMPATMSAIDHWR